jgi:ankyrin repeat protein
VDQKSFRGGQTRLHVEASKGTLEAVQDLVENQQARTDIKDNSGMTPYQIAFQMGRKDIANYLRNFAM